MQISNEYPVLVFKREYEDKTFYSLGLSKKNQDGTYMNGYMECRFKKGVEIDNQTNIFIKNAWLSFYLKENKTIPYVFINEYQLVADVIKETSTSIELDDIDINDTLPF